MSKSKKFPQFNSYHLLAEDGGYAVYKVTIDNGKVVAETKVHEADVLKISMAILARELKKDFGA